MMKGKGWEVADRVSDQIINMVDHEAREMRKLERADPLQLFAAEIVALKSLMAALPPGPKISSVLKLKMTLNECLASVLAQR